MGNFLKKNWFVSLLIVVFAVISVYYTGLLHFRIKEIANFGLTADFFMSSW